MKYPDGQDKVKKIGDQMGIAFDENFKGNDKGKEMEPFNG